MIHMGPGGDFGCADAHKFVETCGEVSSILVCRVLFRRGMAGAEKEVHQPLRRRLKRKCPVWKHAPEDTPGGVRCGTAHEPAPEPFARPFVASGVSENGHDARALRREDEAVDRVEQPPHVEEHVTHRLGKNGKLS